MASAVGKFIKSPVAVEVKSLTQTLLPNRQLLLSGDVAILLNQKMHVWADRAFLDQNNGTLHVLGSLERPLVAEYGGALFCAQQLYIDTHQKTGYAKDLTLNLKEGTITASSAVKKNDFVWEMSDIIFTPCDHELPHWHISAMHAAIRGGYFLTAQGVVFKIGSFPIFGLPYIVLPLQGQSSSGFLIPRFFFDPQYGFGFRQEYYHAFSPHADTTIAFDWRDRRGVVLSDEIRYASSPSNHLSLRGHYALSRDMLAPQGASLFKQTKHRYLIHGEAYQQRVLGEQVISNRFVRIDVGTDKRIGYHFFNKLADVDNIFQSKIMEHFAAPGVGSGHLSIENQVARYAQFNDDFFNVEQAIFYDHKTQGALHVYHEFERKIALTKLPQFFFSTGYRPWGGNVYHKCDLLFDHPMLDYSLHERVYYQSKLVDERFPVKKQSCDWLRFQAESDFMASFAWGTHRLTGHGTPRFIWRTINNNQDKLVCGVQASFSAAYSPGELYAQVEWVGGERTNFFIKPELQLFFTPPHWLHDELLYIDMFDACYEKKSIEGHLFLGTSPALQQSCCWQAFLSCGYDAAKEENRSRYDRSISSHWQPLRLESLVTSHGGRFLVRASWDLPKKKLLDYFCKVEYQHSCAQGSFGYLHVSKELSNVRALLAPASDYFVLEQSFFLGEHVTLSYSAQVSRETIVRGFFPIIQRVGLEYKNHCWSAYCSFEEKRYREYGHEKSERLITFIIKFDALGSFAKRFKQYGLSS